MKNIVILFIVSCFLAFGSNNVIADDNTANSQSDSASQAVGVGSQSQQTHINFPDHPEEQRMNSEGKGYRGFPEPGNATYPNTPGFYANPTRGSLFVEIKNFLNYKDEFTFDDTVNMNKDVGDFKAIPTFMTSDPEKVYKGIVKGYVNRVEDAEVLGFVSIGAKDPNITSVGILGVITKIVRERGGNAFHINGDGVERELRASGWGVSLTGTHASISSGETAGNIVSPGLGYSEGKAGYKDLPWMQVFILNTK